MKVSSEQTIHMDWGAVIDGSGAASGVTVTPETEPAPSSTTNYSMMTSSRLDEYIQDRVKDCTRHSEAVRKSASELLPALLEMESRFVKQERARTDLHELQAQGWHEYLESRGIKPATFRKWKQRNPTMTLLHAIVESPKPRRTRSGGAGRDGDGGRDVQRPSDLLAKAAVHIAKLALNPLLTPAERKEKVEQYAEQIIEADADGSGDISSQPDGTKKLATVVETAERYIRVLEKVVYSPGVKLTEEQQNLLAKRKAEWRSLLRYARGLEAERKGDGVSVMNEPTALKEAA